MHHRSRFSLPKWRSHICAGMRRITEGDMKSFAQSLALFLPLLTADLSASSQQRSTWINQEITDPARVPIQKVDEFINQTCQPSNLDGIQILGVQNGHDDSIKLHVYCRQDNAA